MRVVERTPIDLTGQPDRYEARELWRTENDCYYIASQVISSEEAELLDELTEVVAVIGGIDLAESFPNQPHGPGRETIVFAADKEGEIESWTAIVGGKDWTIADALTAFEAL